MYEGRNAQAQITGERGRGGLTGLLLGSVSLAVAARATCSVIVVRGDGPVSKACTGGSSCVSGNRGGEGRRSGLPSTRLGQGAASWMPYMPDAAPRTTAPIIRALPVSRTFSVRNVRRP
ncbi:universal stress protein [Streptomyces sp. NPDC057565]|uniref:universal stress protein n=1 Tax=Streptomyces sp. NPDC057565 TaxID=3346169 RepID=UPI0036A863E9